jgi:hypothetical protein
MKTILLIFAIIFIAPSFAASVEEPKSAYPSLISIQVWQTNTQQRSNIMVHTAEYKEGRFNCRNCQERNSSKDATYRELRAIYRELRLFLLQKGIAKPVSKESATHEVVFEIKAVGISSKTTILIKGIHSIPARFLSYLDGTLKNEPKK